MFAYTTVKLVQHTPVYKSLECVTTSTEFGEQETDAYWVNMSGTAEKSCTNRNPYNVRLSQGDPAKVYVKTDFGLSQVGESFVLDSRFRAEGNGTGGLELKIALPFFEALTLLAKETVQVVTEVNAQAEAEIFFLGVGFRIAEKSSKVCGFEIATGSPQKVGYSACADSVEELVIPAVNDTTEVADLISMSPELFEYETGRKNLAFGSLMAAFAVLSASCLACGMWISRRRGQDARDLNLDFPAIEKEVAELRNQLPAVDEKQKQQNQQQPPQQQQQPEQELGDCTV